mmetsp:Transcript_97772/g.276719  ORF Transcript_97772/g.276719 Transcript_97772/m.276719 type:complete len:253 (-) Transcript_97772:214-972(-)
MVPQRPVDPDVLAARHGHLLGDLLEETRLLVAHCACLLWIGLSVAFPLGHDSLEIVRVNVHDVLQGEYVVPGQPTHCVTLACAHRSTSENHPRPVLRLHALRHAPHFLVLPGLSRSAVVCVPPVVQRFPDRGKFAVQLPMPGCIVDLRRTGALGGLGNIVRVTMHQAGWNSEVVVLRDNGVDVLAGADSHESEQGIPLDAMPELGKANLAALVGVQAGEKPANLNLRQRKVQLVHANVDELVGRDRAALVRV